MAKMAQFRYYSKDNPNNSYPSTDGEKSYTVFCGDVAFRAYAPIHQFGIQTLPGTKLFINQSQNPIIVGGTGVFEVDCDATTATINSFRIDQKSMETIDKLINGYLIIDIVYGSEED